jgi:predicted ATP-dependent endonuclease of OLD family
VRLSSFRVSNFRRLRNIRVSVEKETTIFVGANNSGKTSATKVFRQFIGETGSKAFSMHDFSYESWKTFTGIGDAPEDGVDLPAIELDIWFELEATDLHRAMPLIPSLDWELAPVGIRFALRVKSRTELLDNYGRARAQALKAEASGSGNFHAWPTSLPDYLSRQLASEYEVQISVLDCKNFGEDWNPIDEAPEPRPLADTYTAARAIVSTLIRVDFLDAQRYLSDDESGRSERLSRRLGKFYDHNLEIYDDGFQATRALADSERLLNEHLAQVFQPTLKQLNALGYPGFSNPYLVIESSVDENMIFSSSNTSVRYALDRPSAGSPPNGVEPMKLPGSSNGLGFKNLIYMVIELLDYQAKWTSLAIRPLVHLVMIEEPEAHLHAQLQQVFISQIRRIIDDIAPFTTQLIVTTHSSHIIYEAGFDPIRYFRREEAPAVSATSVSDLSNFLTAAREPFENLAQGTDQTVDDTGSGIDGASAAATEETRTRQFLLRYMRLTHCDLFFADAAVLVEGNVERLLLPLFIDKCATGLQSRYLSILEVGGAFAYRFRELVEFIGMPTLVITDLDSVSSSEKEDPDEEGDEGHLDRTPRRKAVMANEANARTSNETLKQWLPRRENIADLLESDGDDRTSNQPCAVHVSYQQETTVQWNGHSEQLAGRTLEEAFAFENLEWVQDERQVDLQLRFRKAAGLTFTDLTQKIFKRVRGSGFKKTEFALALFDADPSEWKVPTYIVEGLLWLDKELVTRLGDASPVEASLGLSADSDAPDSATGAVNL